MRPDRAALAGAAAAAVLLGAQLLVEPVVGLADNADFAKVMAPAGLAYSDAEADRFFLWAPSRFAFAPPRPEAEGYRTSETALARAAVLAARAAGARDFDIRILGGLHAALLVAALGLLISAGRALTPAARWTSAALLVLVFTDVAYAAPLNSLYGQAASLVFLMLTLGFAARGAARGALSGAELAAFTAAAVLFVFSKPQESVQAPLLAALGLRLAWPGPGRRGGIAAAGVLLVAGHLAFHSTPPSLRRVALYHAVFTELLPNSPDPARDLARLGLPAESVRFSGTTAYDPRAPLGDAAFRNVFDARVGYAALARIYVSEPERLAGVLRRAAWKGARMRPPFFGNFQKDAGRPPRAMASRFGVWSGWKLQARPVMLGLWVAALGGTIAACLGTRRRASPPGGLARDLLLAVCLMAALELAVCTFADAHLELVRHLYVFHALFDLVLTGAAVWGVQTLALRRRA